MNKGFKTYFKEGLKEARRTFKSKFINYIKFYFVLIIEIIGSLFLLPIPLFKHFNLRLSQNVYEYNDFDLSKALVDFDKPKLYYNSFIFIFVRFLSFIGTLIIGLLITGLFGFFGLIIDNFLANGIFLFTIILSAPFLLATICYCIYVLLKTNPGIFILNKKDASVSDCYHKATGATRNLKKTIFGLYFVPFILMLLYLALSLFIEYFLNIKIKVDVKNIVLFLTGMVLLIIFLFSFARMITGRNTALYMLYNDCLKDNIDNDKDILLNNKKENYINSLFNKKEEEFNN